MEWMPLAIAVAVGAVAGAAAVLIGVISSRGRHQKELANAQARAMMLDDQLARTTDDNTRLRDEHRKVDQAREAAEKRAAVIAQQLQVKQQQFDEQRRLLEDAEKKLGDSFASLGANALRDNNQQFLELAQQTFEKLMQQAAGDVEKKQQAIDSLVKPIRELLEKQSVAVTEIEKKREGAYVKIEEQIRAIAQSHEKLGTETGKLVSALRRPEQRGRWGELALRNTVELAGMNNHCDFDEQVTIWHGEGSQRPDMVVNVPGRGVIPVDAKVAIDAYLSALECEDGPSKAECLRRHADQVERHIKALANKRYWDCFESGRAPQLVVLFMPLESALVAALEIKPDLLNDSMNQKVLVATPTLLVALLRAVAYGWQQDAVAQNAREIAQAGAELYGRVRKFVTDLEKVGNNLRQASTAYNTAIGSLEARVLPSARKIKDLHATAEDQIETPELADSDVRAIVSAELKPQPQEPAAAFDFNSMG